MPLPSPAPWLLVVVTGRGAGRAAWEVAAKERARAWRARHGWPSRVALRTAWLSPGDYPRRWWH